MVGAQSHPGAPAPCVPERARACDAPASSEHSYPAGVQFQLGFLRESMPAWQPGWGLVANGLGCQADTELLQGREARDATCAGEEQSRSDANAPALAAAPLFQGADGPSPSCSAAAQ